jgi:hypothetical protein
MPILGTKGGKIKNAQLFQNKKGIALYFGLTFHS